jgi:DNA-binding CsgD family transcriptional regulator
MELTVRETKMLALLAEGATSRLIAKRVKLEEGTVRVYLHNLYKKIGVIGFAVPKERA